MINKRLLRNWVNALKDTKAEYKYRQSQKRLRTGEKEFCATGVLCDLVDPCGWRNLGHQAWIFEVGEMTYNCSLPSYIQKDLGLSHYEIIFIMKMNDKGFSFGDIAEYIEERYLNG